MTKKDQKKSTYVAERTDPRLEGRYANYFKVGYNAYEFVIDFGKYNTETEQADISTRIIVNPAYAGELLRLLQYSIEQYEKQFGKVRQ